MRQSDCCGSSPEHLDADRRASRITGILRASRKLYKEALPELYRLRETRIPLPRRNASEPINACDDVLASLENLGRQHTRSILVTGELFFQAVHGERKTVGLTDELPNYWTSLQRQLPNLQHLRVHVDARSGPDGEVSFDPAAFAGIGDIPQLRDLQLVVHSADDRKPNEALRWNVEDNIKGRIEKRVGSVQIRGELFEWCESK